MIITHPMLKLVYEPFTNRNFDDMNTKLWCSNSDMQCSISLLNLEELCIYLIVPQVVLSSRLYFIKLWKNWWIFHSNSFQPHHYTIVRQYRISILCWRTRLFQHVNRTKAIETGIILLIVDIKNNFCVFWKKVPY